MLKQSSRGSIFQILGTLFKKHSIQPVLVGGYAVIAYDLQRMTFDVDFMLTLKDFQVIENDLFALGYSVFNRTEAFVQLKSETGGLRDLDFLLVEDATVQGLLGSGKQVVIAGESFVVPSIPHLIAMKIHSIAGNKYRELKDFPDIVHLVSANKINPADEEIRQLFEKRGAMELYERVVKAVTYA